MKKILACVLAMLLVALVPLAAQSTKAIKVGVSIPTADHGWTGGLNYWAQTAITEWKGKDKNVTFYLVTADTPAKQVNDIEDLMVKGIDALVVLAYDSSSLTPVVKKAFEKGIYVVSVDRGLTEPVQQVYIAGDNPGLGQVSAEWMAKAMGGKGDIVVIEGIPCVINTERVDTFKETMAKKAPGIKILDSQPGNWDTQKALEIMTNYLQKYKKIDAVWCQDDDMLIGVLQAYKESGRTDIKTFLGGAGSKGMIKKVMDGDALVRADVTYPPSMIGSGISLAIYGSRGLPIPGFYQGKIPSKVILAAELITKDNAKAYYNPKDMF